MPSNSRITKKDLESYVSFLNKSVCKNTKNHFVVTGAYGGYGVSLTGKRNKNGTRKKGSMGTAHHQVSNGHDSARKTIDYISKSYSNGFLKEIVNRYERK